MGPWRCSSGLWVHGDAVVGCGSSSGLWVHGDAVVGYGWVHGDAVVGYGWVHGDAVVGCSRVVVVHGIVGMLCQLLIRCH